MQLPQEFLCRMKNMLGPEFGEFLEAYSRPPEAGIRVNPNRSAPAVEAMTKKLERVPWCADGYYIDKTELSGNDPYHMAGAFYFQEPSAMAAAAALPINEGDAVLDLCAAPGGKATHAGAVLGGSGLLAANEIVPRRAEILAENIERMGIANAAVMNENPARLAERFPEAFDKVIVDAPCSGEGMFRRDERAVTEWSAEHSAACAARQRNILDSAVKLLKNGGLLLYSTCTFAKEENEDNVRYLISEYGMTLEPICLEGVSGGIDMPEAVRIYPHKSRGEGHFAALLRKNSGGVGELPGPQSEKSAEAAMRAYREFEQDALNVRLEGTPCLFGGRLYLAYIDADRLRVPRPGLFLGECKKNRFEPSHALAHALRAADFKRTLEAEGGAAENYMRGETLPCSENGWTAVLCGGLPLGWGKASGGVLKNHFPKKLRIK